MKTSIYLYSNRHRGGRINPEYIAIYKNNEGKPVVVGAGYINEDLENGRHIAIKFNDEIKYFHGKPENSSEGDE